MKNLDKDISIIKEAYTVLENKNNDSLEWIKEQTRESDEKLLTDCLKDIPNVNYEVVDGRFKAKLDGITFSRKIGGEYITSLDFIIADHKCVKKFLWFKYVRRKVSILDYHKFGAYTCLSDLVNLSYVLKQHLEALEFENEKSKNRG